MKPNSISQDEFEKIEAYLNKSISKEDLIIFENRLLNEDHLSSKVEDVKTLLAGLETQAMKEQLDLFHKDVTEDASISATETKIRTLNWKKMAIAAVFLIAAGSFWFLRGNSNERLYADYFTPDPGLPTTMSSSDNYEFYEAMVDYKQGHYKTAITKWQTLQNLKPKNDTLNYFIGVAHLANKKENTAISYLENATQNSKFALASDAYYYLGLAYLKEGNIEKAKANFQKSTIDNSKVLLSKLND